jgi:hypothetical protein
MRNLRNAMLVAVVAATALAAIGGYFLADPQSRLLVDAGLAVALAVIVAVMLSPTVARTESLVDALRALARGDRHQRVDANQFAGLAEVARATNEVAASLTEGEDSNIGPIKSTPRPGRSARKEARLPSSKTSGHPEIGPVRVVKKANGEAAKNNPFANAKTRVLSLPPVEPPAPAEGGVPEEAARPTVAAATNDTNVDEAPRSDLRESDPPQVPSRVELEALFHEFVATKKSHGEPVADLDVDAFAQTIQGECERLIGAHRCRGVRFDVTMQDGEVSLRPRLLR